MNNSFISPYIHFLPRSHNFAAHILSYLPPSLNLSLTPLLVLASLPYIPKRTIQTGTSSLLDSLIICPGLHKQSEATSLNEGEYPATAAMTTGYVFRTENQAMVHYMQCVGVTGSLVTLSVKPIEHSRRRDFLVGPGRLDGASLAAVGLTLDVLAGCWVVGDNWALASVGMLIVSRFVNVLAIRRRRASQWHGAREPGVKGDLLVLLSQDRWMRIKGWVDDLKAVTSGQWLREPGLVEQCLVDAGAVLAYGAVVVGFNATQRGAMMIASLLLGSSVLLGISNWKGRSRLSVHERVVEVLGEKKYERRTAMAKELIEESGRRDWAVRMGMIGEERRGTYYVIMFCAFWLKA
jgi:hypothetical protein